MSKAKKIWLIVGASLVAFGGIVFTVMMFLMNWNFTKLSTNKYSTTTHTVTEQIQSITVDTDTADLEFVPSVDGTYSVICYEEENRKNTVAVIDGTLTVKSMDERKWYEYIGINFQTSKITVCIPQGKYGALSVSSDTGDVKIPREFQFQSIDISESTGDVRNHASVSDVIKIRTSTGAIFVEGVFAGTIDLSVSTGDVTVSEVTCGGNITVGVSTGKVRMTNVTCKNVISSGDTGDMSLNNVIASETFSFERSTGDVRFDGCDAAEIFVKTDTGDVRGSLLSEKVFLVTTDTGEKDVPNTVTGGRCEITTDTGDIKIRIG